jgi:hypothetical protein
MIWILTICTAAWGICGTVKELEYPTEEQCYKSMEAMYRQQGRESFKYITCSPKLKGGKHD